MPLTPRFQAPVDDPKGSLGQLSRVVDALAPQQAYAPARAAIVQVGAGETRRVAPRASGTTVVIPPADDTNYGALITLLVDGTLGTTKVKPISGTVNGAASFTLATGYQSLLVLMSDGEGRWLTERAEGYPLTNGDKGDITVSGNGDNWQIDASAVGTTELAANAVTTAKITDLNVTTAKLAADAVTQAKLADASVEPANLVPSITFGVPFVMTVSLPALAAGTPDDVDVLGGPAPYDIRIIDVWVLLATAVGGSTVQVRSATGGGGSALSSAMSSAATGTVRNNDTASRAVNSGGSIVIRRSDRAVSGRAVVLALRE